jgi:hypothetical protein
MAHTDPHAPSAGGAQPATGHETRDVHLGGATRFIVVMSVFLAVVFAFIWFVFVTWRADTAAPAASTPAAAARTGDRLPPLPRLQTTPYADLKAFRADETQVLETYAWVDKEKGVVRIPIARAIELVAERGLPAAATPEAGAATGGGEAGGTK